MAYRTAGVIGGGAWGTALALVCARAGLDVILQAREPEVVESVTNRRINEAFLPGVVLDERISVTAELSGLSECDLVLAVPPAQFMRSTLAAYASHHKPGAPIVLCSKGIERGSLKLMTEVLAETIPDAPAAVLSGPSFAADVSKGLPTAVTLACEDAVLGEALMETLSGPAFRPYLATDLIGAEVGGAIKNVLAIACGLSEGRRLGKSAHAALITRGFAEMTRLGVALGGEPETVAGLCGLGDLVLTCSSPQSRNMSLGLALGEGQTIEQALAGKRSVAEGYESAPAVRELARKMGVEMPICEATAALLAGETTVDAMIEGLLSRPLKAEQGMSDAAPAERKRVWTTPANVALCALDDIAEPGSRGFVLQIGEAYFHGFVVRKDGEVAGWVDRCPHQGFPIAIEMDRYLTPDGSLILCGWHGAVFEPLSGARAWVARARAES